MQRGVQDRIGNFAEQPHAKERVRASKLAEQPHAKEREGSSKLAEQPHAKEARAERIANFRRNNPTVWAALAATAHIWGSRTPASKLEN